MLWTRADLMDGYEFSGISFVPKTLERMREVNQYKLALFGAKLRLTMVRDVLHNQINGKRGVYRLEVGPDASAICIECPLARLKIASLHLIRRSGAALMEEGRHMR